MEKTDLVDRVLAQWKREKPELDPWPMAIMGRLVRADAIFSKTLQGVFKQFGLNGGEFDVLATLRRSGQPYALTPNQLLQTLMLTSGSMTNRIDRLEEKSLVKRSPDPNDRRGVVVSLTQQGLKVIDEVIVEHVAKGNDLLAPLEYEEQQQLANLLKKLLVANAH
ncbi:Transcriptional regulator, MarR family [Pseudoalteromonas luteoviolacea B = ATCC 29581]|nr:Transcriptional regulator, MarR family [Pseudoalteromonas luteoviolacea B = ATCC 29581]